MRFDLTVHTIIPPWQFLFMQRLYFSGPGFSSRHNSIQRQYFVIGQVDEVFYRGHRGEMWLREGVSVSETMIQNIFSANQELMQVRRNSGLSRSELRVHTAELPFVFGIGPLFKSRGCYVVVGASV